MSSGYEYKWNAKYKPELRDERLKEREQEYVKNKGLPMNEQYANGSVGASVRLMIRGGNLQVRGG